MAAPFSTYLVAVSAMLLAASSALTLIWFVSHLDQPEAPETPTAAPKAAA